MVNDTRSHTDTDRSWFEQLRDGWFTLVASLLSALIVAGVSNCNANRQATLAYERSMYSEQRSSALTNFRADADNLERHVATIVQKYGEYGQIDPVTLSYFIEDIANQSASAQSLKPYARSPDNLDQYVLTLGELRSNIDTSTDVTELRPFWENVSEVIHLRGEILKVEAAYRPD